MKKKLIITVVSLVLLGGIGFGVYRVGMNYASNKMINTVTKEMQQSGELDKLKQSIKNDPNLKKQMQNDPQFRKLLAQSKLGSTDNNSGSKTNSKDNSKSGSASSSSSKSSSNATSSNQGNSGNSAASGSQNSSTSSQSSVAKLPFNTKDGAAQVLVSKVGLSELQSMYSKVKAGTMTKAQVVQVLKSRLSPEDITALKLVAYQEASK